MEDRYKQGWSDRISSQHIDDMFHYYDTVYKSCIEGSVKVERYRIPPGAKLNTSIYEEAEVVG